MIKQFANILTLSTKLRFPSYFGTHAPKPEKLHKVTDVAYISAFTELSSI